MAVYEYTFTITGIGSVELSSNTRILSEEHRLGGNGLTLEFWLHGYANDTALEAALQTIASYSVDFDRLVRHQYPGMKGFTAINLDGEENIGTLSKRGGAGSWANCVMSFPRISRYYPPQPPDSKVGCKGTVTLQQLAPG